MDIEALVDEAAAVLDEVSMKFVEGHRADPAVRKKGDDFATEMDYAIERHVGEALRDLTGIGVHGEEYRQAGLDAPLVWVLDPIDGTFNYAAGSPMAAILLALLRDGEPVAGLTWLPFTGDRYRAVAGGALSCNGIDLPVLGRGQLATSAVGVGSFNVASRGRLPGRYRAALVAELSRTSSKIRMHGSAGIDMAFVAAGILGGAVIFGGQVWDHAAGTALIRAAGGTVTDLDGRVWSPQSRSVVAGAPGVHEEIMAIIAGLGPPEEYR